MVFGLRWKFLGSCGLFFAIGFIRCKCFLGFVGDEKSGMEIPLVSCKPNFYYEDIKVDFIFGFGKFRPKKYRLMQGLATNVPSVRMGIRTLFLVQEIQKKPSLLLSQFCHQFG